MNSPRFNSSFRLSGQAYATLPARDFRNSSSILNGQKQSAKDGSVRYDWAWEKYLDASALQWMPREIDMQGDFNLWSHYKRVPENEKILKDYIQALSGSRVPQTQNIVLQLYRHITSYECRQFLLREAFEEGLHSHSIQYIIESLRVRLPSPRLQKVQGYSRYKEKLGEAIQDKLAMPSGLGGGGNDPATMLELLGQYYLVYKGIVSQGCLAFLIYMARDLKLLGTAEILGKLLKTVNGHSDFGAAVIEQIKMEFPDSFSELSQLLLKKEIELAVDMEIDFFCSQFSHSLQNSGKELFEEYFRYVGNLRMAQAGILPTKDLQNPIPWLDAYLLPMENIKEPSMN